uniref:leucine-rich repeat-containing protein 3-like n=1 Tax=Myxine glutinosa TaxID=7769 RepID=UPI00358EF73C
MRFPAIAWFKGQRCNQTWLRDPRRQLSLLLLVVSMSLCGGHACPVICNCTRKAGGFLAVQCNKQGLAEVPKGLPANTTLLSLRSNHIAELHNNAFLGLAWLRELDLSDNVVETVYPGAFQGVQDSLLFLNLSGNQLQTLSKTAFQQLKASIRLDGNPLHCGCDLQEVLNSIHLDPGTKSHLTCVTSQQESVRGRPFIQAGQEMDCNMPRKTMDVAMLVTMAGWFTMVVAYVVYYVRTNQEDARRHLEYLKSLPSDQFKPAQEVDTLSTVL